MEIFIYIILGAIIGVFSGFFGIGGGIILTPLLLLLGFSPTLVIGTSLMLSLGTSISGAIAHFRLKNIQWRYVAVINIAGIIGTQIAHPIMLNLDTLGHAEAFISISYIALLTFFSFTLLKKQRTHRLKRSPLLSPMLIAGLIGLGAGFISAALGVSGGFFIVPLLIALLGLKVPHAVGTSLASVVFIVSAGFLSYSMSSSLNYLMGISLIIGTFIGAPLGAKATSLVEEKSLRRFLGILYICMIASVLSNIFSLSSIGLFIICTFTIIFFFILTHKYLQQSPKRKITQ
ncbi:sulfite exporter TauE/SafE family protein [Halalkalibacter nanhaiisediminis]|uniref:Probable membrane transporter protein n=1 Tax=Halalkalibacter nanhaiisediminis TaxID=688079 RepID=A0A562QM80_9BACI|nr:sulfite exporter TauE/SafE family protein [Halalkalibacter nanhaiisediminis]TWI57861.1 hypothetical protein IQ10_01190 [Halalkalibacter nanhaiisediminis]